MDDLGRVFGQLDQGRDGTPRRKLRKRQTHRPRRARMGPGQPHPCHIVTLSLTIGPVPPGRFFGSILLQHYFSHAVMKGKGSGW